MSTAAFRLEIAREQFHLTRAALALAKGIAFPALDIDLYMATLEDLGEVVAAGLQNAPDPLTQARQLATYLFGGDRFHGNQDAYYDPDNSFLNRVIDYHLGIPISLSVLFLEIADQLQLSAYGIGLPGHFIVGVVETQSRILLDPFHEGRVLSTDDCLQLVQRTTGYRGQFQQFWLRPVEPKMILSRMLNNLRMMYMQREAWDSADSVIDHLNCLHDDMPELLRDRGLIKLKQGNVQAAGRYLEAYLAKRPDATDADILRKNLGRVFKQYARWN